MLNLINHEPHIDNCFLYAKKDPYEAKYKLLINKREGKGLRYFNDSKAFIECSNDIDDIYKTIGEYYANKKRKILFVFDMIANIYINKKLHAIVTEVFIRGRKLNISPAFILKSYFAGPKNIRLNSTDYFVVKISNKRKLQKIPFNHSSDIDFQELMILYKRVLQNHVLFSLSILSAENSSRFRKNLLKRI